jgi:hypothetical protein
MPQAQLSVPLVLANGTQSLATATGNNAAWNCPCGQHQHPLIGKSVATPVECPACHTQFRVISDEGTLKRVSRVEQIA